MKHFSEWFGDQGRPVGAAGVDEDDLPDGLYMMAGVINARCMNCQSYYPWPAGIEDFQGPFDDYNLCGGQFCCP